MKNKKIFIGIVIFVAIIATILYFNIKGSRVLTQDEAVVAAQQEAGKVKTDLGKHFVFPDGDEPDIRKINEKVEDPFFTRAEIGDYLIIFYKSRIAFIYSPSKDIIVNAGVVFANLNASSTKANTAR